MTNLFADRQKHRDKLAALVKEYMIDLVLTPLEAAALITSDLQELVARRLFTAAPEDKEGR